MPEYVDIDGHFARAAARLEEVGFQYRADRERTTADIEALANDLEQRLEDDRAQDRQETAQGATGESSAWDPEDYSTIHWTRG